MKERSGNSNFYTNAIHIFLYTYTRMYSIQKEYDAPDDENNVKPKKNTTLQYENKVYELDPFCLVVFAFERFTVCTLVYIVLLVLSQCIQCMFILLSLIARFCLTKKEIEYITCFVYYCTLYMHMFFKHKFDCLQLFRCFLLFFISLIYWIMVVIAAIIMTINDTMLSLYNNAIICHCLCRKIII